MAKIVIGIGSSQSPLVSVPAEHWGAYGKGDKTNMGYRLLDNIKNVAAGIGKGRCNAAGKGLRRYCHRLVIKNKTPYSMMWGCGTGEINFPPTAS